MFGFTRMRSEVKEKISKILEHLVKKQRTFDYNYYISKNCPMPDDWKNEKVKLDEMAKDPK